MTPILSTDEIRTFLKSYRPPARRTKHYTWSDAFPMTPARLSVVADKLAYYTLWFEGMTPEEQKDAVGEWVSSNILMYTFILNDQK